MFCAAGFIMICTLLRCILCLQQPERLDLGLNWSIRETVVAIAATNAPCIKPLLVRFRGSRNRSYASKSRAAGLVTIGGSGGDKMSRNSKNRTRQEELDDITTAGSEERLVGGSRASPMALAGDDRDSHEAHRGGSRASGGGGRERIHVTHTYQVERSN